MATGKYLLMAMAVLAFYSTGSAQQFFTDRAVFLTNVRADYYEEKFDDWAPGEPLDGHQETWDAPGANGFSWTASASGTGNGLLYSLSGALSTSSHDDRLVFQFSDSPVYAFGGDFCGTEYDGHPITAEIEFETDTGQLFSHTVSICSFVGFVSNVPISKITIDSFGAQASWPAADNIITGDLRPDGDLDGDGMTNSAEQLAGTDPGDPKSNLRVSSVKFGDSNFVITFSAVAGKSYRLEYKDALMDSEWIALDDQSVDTTGPAQFIDTTAPNPGMRFYRVTVIP
jgi:hypothetical protein